MSKKYAPTRETLVQLYEVERLPIAEIIRRTGCTSIHRHMVKYGISRRSTQTRTVPASIEPSTIDCAYAAGFFDGEGTIDIKRPGASSRTTGFTLAIQVAQTKEDPLIWLRERWGGSVRLVKRKKPTWAWHIGSRLAGNFLQDVFPFLMVKKTQAAVAIEFQSRKRNTGRRHIPEAFELECQSRENLLSCR
jgi:hypothetical protein